jgi:nitrite reductase (NADH) large subunit
MYAKYLIIGNGVAGINAAKLLAQGSTDGDVTVLAGEPHHYYNRWQLPGLVEGSKGIDDVLFYRPDWYDGQGIRVHLSALVASIAPDVHKVQLADGREFEYDKLLIATGARAFIPRIKGVDRPGVYVLRTLDDALAIRERSGDATDAVVIGGGLLGLEAAHSLGHLGLNVTVVEYVDRLLPRQLDAPGSAMFQSLFELSGVRVVTGVATEEIVGEAVVRGVSLSDGSTVGADLVVLSTGIRSNIRLAWSAGIDTDRGIVVGDTMRTSAADVYAAGDCAEFQGCSYGIIPAAIEQARVAAQHMLGGEATSYQGTVASTTLKVAGIDLTCIGDSNAEGDGSEVRFQDGDQGAYRKLVIRDGRITGAILLGIKSDVVPVTRLIKAELDVSAHREAMGQAGFDFRALLAQAAAADFILYECSICGYKYDPRRGDSESGVVANTPFAALPEGWICPQCGAPTERFTRLAE